MDITTLLRQSDCLDVALEERDEYTGVHCGRVEALSVQLGRRYQLDERDLVLLRMAAKLHDVGKIGIPDRILLKPGKLDPDEWEIMKSHTELGQQICEAIPHQDATRVGTIVRHHHECIDGSGYPDRLSGEYIPIQSRIITLVDCYDAMTTARPYHQPRPHEHVMEILRSESGQKIDSLVFWHFQNMMNHRIAELASS